MHQELLADQVLQVAAGRFIADAMRFPVGLNGIPGVGRLERMIDQRQLARIQGSAHRRRPAHQFLGIVDLLGLACKEVMEVFDRKQDHLQLIEEKVGSVVVIRLGVQIRPGVLSAAFLRIREIDTYSHSQ